MASNNYIIFVLILSNNSNTGVSNNTSEKYSIITDALSVETNLSNVRCLHALFAMKTDCANSCVIIVYEISNR